jgi:hypothetical protein
MVDTKNKIKNVVSNKPIWEMSPIFITKEEEASIPLKDGKYDFEGKYMIVSLAGTYYNFTKLTTKEPEMYNSLPSKIILDVDNFDSKYYFKIISNI